MRDISFFNKIYVAIDAVDFRKQAHGLATIVEHSLQFSPYSHKSLFVFRNKKKTAVKILYWDDTGYAMWWKTLEKERFRWPKQPGENTLLVDAKQLRWLLEGIDLAAVKLHKKII